MELDIGADIHAGVDAVRRALHAIANLGDEGHASLVRGLASHGRVGVRAAAVGALASFPSDESAAVLGRALNDPTEDYHVRMAVLDAWNEWPEEAVQSDVVQEAVLRHLAANDGVAWDECYQVCVWGGRGGGGDMPTSGAAVLSKTARTCLLFCLLVLLVVAAVASRS